MEITDELGRIVAEQSGLVHRRQLYEHGVTRSALRAALGRSWTAPLPGVVATFTGALTADQRLLAARLYAGEPALLTGVEACRLHGLLALPAPGRIRFVVPTHRTARTAGWVTVSPSTRLERGQRSVAGIRVVGVARAVVDSAPDLGGPDAAAALVLEAVQRRLALPRVLRHELERAPVGGSRWVRRAIVAAEAGAWSAPEADLLRLLADSAVLPEVVPNPVLETPAGQRLPRPDAWIPGVGIAVQVHSRKHHAQDRDFDRTLDVDATLTSYGIAVIGVTPRRIRDDGAAVLAGVERTFLQRTRAGIVVDVRMLPQAP